MTREEALQYVVPDTAGLAILSLGLAGYIRCCKNNWLDPYGFALLRLWTIVPPVWFLWEWTASRTLPEAEKEDIKHFHELARNLWLAFVVVLGVIMHAEFPVKGVGGH